MLDKDKVSFLHLPTPIEKLHNVSKDLGINFYLKRDDLTNIGLGGNKLRKLEFLLKEAMDNKATMLITTGGAQTNHGRLTAAVAAKYNLKCAIVSFDKYPEEITGNILLDRIFGADVIFQSPSSDESEIKGFIKETILKYESQGEKVYYIPMGGSSPIGSLGYYNCAKEISEQTRSLNIKNPRIITAVGSMGTYTGLYCGINHMNLDLRLTGIAISPFDDGAFKYGENLINKFNKYFSTNISMNSFHIEEDYSYGGYNNVIKEVRESVYYMGKKEGIILDPCYTGKAFNGICKMIEESKIEKGENIILIHTGGSPGINASNHRLEFEKELLSGIRTV